MESAALPRLQNRLSDLAPASDVGVAVTEVAGARRVQQSRSSLPKSADANSSHRGIRYGLRSAVARVGTDEETVNSSSSGSTIVRTQRQFTGQPSQQWTRPSSTRTSARRTSRGSPNQVASSEAPSEHRDQQLWQAVQSENEQLRHEITLLQRKLVEKMRGNAKILVGGGQFRAFAGSSPMRSLPSTQNPGGYGPPVANNQSCKSCTALQASIKKARDSYDHDQSALLYRIQQLEQGEFEIQATLHQREDDVCSLQLQHMQAREAVTNQQLQLRDDDINRLRDQLAVAQAHNEEELLQQKHASTAASVVRLSGATAQTQTDNEPMRDELERARKSAASATEQLVQSQHLVAELQIVCADLRAARLQNESEYSRMARQIEHERAVSQARAVQFDQEVAALKLENEALLHRSKRLERSVDHLERLAATQRATQAEQTAEWQQQLSAKDRVLDDHTAQRTENVNVAMALRARVEELETQLSQKDEELGASLARCRDVSEANSVLQETVQRQTTELDTVAKHYDHANKTSSELRAQVDQLQQQFDNSTRALANLQTAIDQTEAQLLAASAEALARDDVQRRLKRAHAAALEKALQSVVRLCVVAPTVNVHLGSSPGGSSVVTCKSVLPQQQLRAVVEQDVLPLFATVFAQSQESCGPQGGPMDPWLHGLLREMQESLATHLQKIYAATTSPTTVAVQ